MSGPWLTGYSTAALRREAEAFAAQIGELRARLPCTVGVREVDVRKCECGWGCRRPCKWSYRRGPMRKCECRCGCRLRVESSSRVAGHSSFLLCPWCLVTARDGNARHGLRGPFRAEPGTETEEWMERAIDIIENLLAHRPTPDALPTDLWNETMNLLADTGCRCQRVLKHRSGELCSYCSRERWMAKGHVSWPG